MNLAVVVVAGGYDPSPDHIAKLVDLARPGKHDSSALTASAAALAIATRSASPAWQRLKTSAWRGRRASRKRRSVSPPGAHATEIAMCIWTNWTGIVQS